ncbi:receptor-transporting protein 4 [Mesocricetus auratus]|uniref:Receptor-transporting protein 4 n=1 Tax=Mesocricetus auratus TaxID=10036 RepID=A0A1U7QDQ9_MESAU|nr:receptor-transporting protein 4 [Mesocricetus auratus]
MFIAQPPPQKMFSDASTWEQMFQELIQEEKPRAKWTLQLDKNILPDGMAQGWRQYQQTGVGSFQCSICDRRWVSAQVKILYHLHWEPGLSQGRVRMRIFAQRCQKCRSEFENPEFSTDSIQRILENLVSYILRRYYRHSSKKPPSTLYERVPLDGPHDTANCEACALGYHGRCAFAYEAKPPSPPSSPPTSSSSSAPKSHHFLLHSYGFSPEKSHTSSAPLSSSSAPKSHSSSPEKSLSVSPAKSHSSSPQTWTAFFENAHIPEHREPHNTGLLTALFLAALALIRLFFR